MVPVGKHATFVDKTIFIASSCFQFFSGANIEQQECRVKFWNFWGSFGHFYTLTGFSRNLCAKFEIELHAHALVHKNGLKNQMCVLGCKLRSHARNENECQTY